MRVLVLDISTSLGWALLEGDQPSSVKPRLLESGIIVADPDSNGYPWNYVFRTRRLADEVMTLVVNIQPDVIVIEETNLGRQRYSQKMLEFCHLGILSRLGTVWPVFYVNTRSWRETLGLRLTKDQKKANAKLSKAKRTALQKGAKLDKKALGIKGKVNWKHLAVAYVNATYGTSFKMKDNDVADAVCLGTAYFLGVGICDGTGNH